MSQIEVKHIVKEYQRKKHYTNMGKAFSTMFRPEYEVKRAVDDVSFSIEKGESIGYVGPNGSGKSTTIKMLCGILCPTEGSIRVRGIDPFQERTKNSKNIGVVFGNRSVLWWDVPVIESYKVLQQLYEIPERQFQENLEKFQDIMGIGSLLSVPERQLSLGQRMRCNIAAAFLHNPETVSYTHLDVYKRQGWDDPKTIGGIQPWLDFVTEGLSPTLEQMTNTDPDSMFQGGQAAMYLSGNYMIPSYNKTLEGKYGIVSRPTFNGKDVYKRQNLCSIQVTGPVCLQR